MSLARLYAHGNSNKPETYANMKKGCLMPFYTFHSPIPNTRAFGTPADMKRTNTQAVNTHEKKARAEAPRPDQRRL